MCQAAMGPKLPLLEEHSRIHRAKRARWRRGWLRHKKREMPGSQQDGVGPPPGHDERLFGVGGVESWSRRRPTCPVCASMLYHGSGRRNRAFTLIWCQVFPLVAS